MDLEKDEKRKVTWGNEMDILKIDDPKKLQQWIERCDDIDTAHMPSANTMLHCAAAMGNLEAITELVEAGANLDVPNIFGLRPIDEAVRSKHWQIVRYLKKCKSPPANLDLIRAYKKAREKHVSYGDLGCSIS